jgi:Methyltransferase domain
LNQVLKPVGFQLLHSVGSNTKGRIKPYYRATQGMTNFDEFSLLYRLATQVPDGCIVEVGSYCGRSTVALGRGSLDGQRVPVFAVEPHEEFIGVLGGNFGPEDRAAFFRAMLDTGCYQVVRLVNLSSEHLAQSWTRPIGLLWIDGDHSYEGVKRDFDCWSPYLMSDSRIAFDDSLDETIGPYRLISELRSQGYEVIETVHKIRVLEKRAG